MLTTYGTFCIMKYFHSLFFKEYQETSFISIVIGLEFELVINKQAIKITYFTSHARLPIWK